VGEVLDLDHHAPRGPARRRAAAPCGGCRCPCSSRPKPRRRRARGGRSPRG
jgi:hypothetical protein